MTEEKKEEVKEEKVEVVETPKEVKEEPKEEAKEEKKVSKKKSSPKKAKEEVVIPKMIGGKTIIEVSKEGVYYVVKDAEGTIYKLPKEEFETLK
jgi:hypothetical protein